VSLPLKRTEALDIFVGERRCFLIAHHPSTTNTFGLNVGGISKSNNVRFGSSDMCAAKSDVCFAPKADMCGALAYVCFGPEADIPHPALLVTMQASLA
jgi:hypothetical protein